MHAYLDNRPGALSPFAWTVAQVAQAFPGIRSPYDAIRLLEDDPLGLVPDILLLRAYASVKAQWDGIQGEGDQQQKMRDQLLQHPMAQWVLDNEFALVTDAREARKKRNEGQ